MVQGDRAKNVWGELEWRKLLSDGGPELSLPLQVVLIKGMEGK